MNFLNGELKEYHRKYMMLLEKRDLEQEKVLSKSNIFNRSSLQKKYETARDAFDDYCHNIYAKAIFEACSQIKPRIIRVRTGECFEWEEMFGSDFSKIPAIRRSMLVGLVEEACGYKFAER